MTQAIVRFFELRLARWKLILELALLVEIAVLFAHPILIFDPKIIPVGNEYGLSLESHVIWLHFQRCGLCFLWNGTLNGGYPAFVDLHGAPLHPLTIFATLVFGLPNSGRVIFFGSLLIAAFAQWWMGYTLGLSPVTRLWMAAIALMGGHLAGKLQMGVITLVLSIACGSLVLAALLNWLYRPSLRAVVLLAWAMVLFALSGQGYIQIILMLIVLPVILVLFFIQRRARRNTHLSLHVMLAIGLSGMILAILLLPLLVFLPNLNKYGVVVFEAAQTMWYAPLNWLIADSAFFDYPILNTLPTFQYLYWNYIGWVPVGLAAVGLLCGGRRHLRLRVALFIAIFLTFLVGHQPLLQMIIRYWTFIGWLRNPALIASMTTPLLLLLSGLGADNLYTGKHFSIVIRQEQRQQVRSPQRILTVFLLLWAVVAVYSVNQPWLTQTLDLRDHAIWEILKSLKTGDSQWVYVPQSEHFYKLYGAQLGLKYTTAIMPWEWKGRTLPLPHRRIIPITQRTDQDVELQKFNDNISMMVTADIPPYYAYVLNEQGEVPCLAQAEGGLITVNCQIETAGTLFVTENALAGWRAEVNGFAQPLVESLWLAVDLPPGQHHIVFRYLPWEVTAGFVITLLGILLSMAVWHYAASPKLQHLIHHLREMRIEIRLLDESPQ